MIRYSSLLLAAALGSTALPAWAEVPRVVTDIPVVGALVQQVMGELGQPEILLQAGGDPHDYQLRPSQARSVQDAGLLIWVGPELTPWLERAATSLSPQAEMLTLLHLPATHRRDYAGDEHEHEHEHEDHDHGHAGEQGHEGHDHSGTDPHAWLDPANGRAWLAAIAETLSRRDPENATTYAANAARAAEEIAALDAELQATLSPAQGKRFVVFHDAYGYFTEHYRLEPAIAVSLGDASTPSAARLQAIRAEIAENGAICAFPEANHDPKLIAAVIEGSEIRQGTALDPEGTGATPGAGLYAETLRGMASALADCLGTD
ncbi:zinc ABC transporter substrate-binding protein (plasmid) [Paracoccus ferrooxidans]|nr:zinc ABC transporter substrate-binding protein [Paracoccus ferrooxidans]